MAYNPNFSSIYPSPYNQNFYNTYPQQQFYNPNMQMQAQQNQQNTMQNQVQPQNLQNTPPVQNSGFIRVQSEEEARRYPVAPGGSVTFIDENAPYCYTKSVDFSQLDRPTFKRFRLVEETAESNNAVTKESETQNNLNLDDFAKKEDLEEIESRYKDLKSQLEKIQKQFQDLASNQQSKTVTKLKKENDKNE